MGFQFRQPRSKMPKLDITISSSQRIVAAGPSNMNQQRVEQPAQSEDAWGEDDEDELLILASQAVEQVEANAAVIISQSMNNHDMSYIRFRQDVRTAQSTQLNPIDEFDNDEDIFSSVPDFVVNPAQPAPSVENKENKAQHAINHQNAQNQPSTSAAYVPRVTSDDKTREKKEKVQNEYYADQLKQKTKQIQTLKESLNKVNQKCTTKEGEASTLRYEVDAKSREIERLRKEKMEEAIHMEKKYSEKIIALEKKIEEQRSELQFKVKVTN